MVKVILHRNSGIPIKKCKYGTKIFHIYELSLTTVSLINGMWILSIEIPKWIDPGSSPLDASDRSRLPIDINL